MNITPEQADRLKRASTDGPWFVHTDPDDVDGAYIYNDPGHMCVAIEPLGSDYRPADLELAAAAPDLAQTVIDQAETIAGMYEEWCVEADGNGLFPVNEENHPNGAYFTVCREFAEAVRDRMTKLCPHVRYRLVRRLVGPVEVVDGE